MNIHSEFNKRLRPKSLQVRFEEFDNPSHEYSVSLFKSFLNLYFIRKSNRSSEIANFCNELSLCHSGIKNLIKPTSKWVSNRRRTVLALKKNVEELEVLLSRLPNEMKKTKILDLSLHGDFVAISNSLDSIDSRLRGYSIYSPKGRPPKKFITEYREVYVLFRLFGSMLVDKQNFSDDLNTVIGKIIADMPAQWKSSSSRMSKNNREICALSYLCCMICWPESGITTKKIISLITQFMPSNYPRIRNNRKMTPMTAVRN